MTPEVKALAADVFGSAYLADQWANSPHLMLMGKRPADIPHEDSILLLRILDDIQYGS